MAEEVEISQEEMVKNTENKEKTDIKSQSDELFGLLAKPDLTAEEKAKVSGVVIKTPHLLLEKEFMEKFKMPDLYGEYKSGGDINELIGDAVFANNKMRQVLDNLKEINPEGLGKTAAAYMLDNAYLPNGELIGTQLVKNNHFLGTVKKDKDHKFYEDDEKNSNVRAVTDTFLTESCIFYKSLYENPDGYCADKASVNAANQNVDDLMRKCQETPDTKIEGLDTREFMRHSDIQAVEKKRDEMIVEQKRGSLTVDQIREKANREGLVVGSDEWNKLKADEEKKKEAALENMHDPQPGKPEHQKGEPFKEGDIIKYMYEEWFLKGMSWLFDKLDEGLENLVDRVVFSRYEAKARNKEEARMAKNEKQKALFEKVAFFDGEVLKRQGKLKNKTTSQVSKYEKSCAFLLDYVKNPSEDKKTAIQASFSDPSFITVFEDSYKKDPEKVTEFLKICPKKIKQVLKHQENLSHIAMSQVAIEMTDEVMRSTGAWCQGSGDLKKNADLMADYDKRVEKRQKDLFEAVSILSTDTRLRTEVEYSQLSDEAKGKYVQDHVLKNYDRLIEQTSDEKMQKGLLEDKKHFEDLYYGRTEEGAKLSLLARQEMIFERIADLKVQEFVMKQTELTFQAIQIQNAERAEGHYDVKGCHPEKRKLEDGGPKKSTKELMAEAKDAREGALRFTRDDKQIFGEEFEGRVAEKMSLFEAAVEDNRPIMYTGMMSEVERKLALCKNEHEKQKERQDFCNAARERMGIVEEKKTEAKYAPLAHGGRI